MDPQAPTLAPAADAAASAQQPPSHAPAASALATTLTPPTAEPVVANAPTPTTPQPSGSAQKTKRARTSPAPASLPLLVYWGARGNGEVARLACVLEGKDWREEHLTDEREVELKRLAGTAEVPFGQWPVWFDKDTVVAQSEAILRYIGANLGGRQDVEQKAVIDQIIAGASALRAKYNNVVWVHNNAPEKRDELFAHHVDPTSKAAKTANGAHFAFLEGFLERSKTRKWVADTRSPSIADIALYEVLDIFARFFGQEKVLPLYPLLAAFHAHFEAIPEIKKYISERRYHEVNGNGIGNGPKPE